MNTTDDYEPYITIRDISQALHIPQRTINHYKDIGVIRSYRIGPKSVRYRLSEVTDALAARGKLRKRQKR